MPLSRSSNSPTKPMMIHSTVRIVFFALCAMWWFVGVGCAPKTQPTDAMQSERGKPYVSEQAIRSYFPLATGHKAADVYVDPDDWKVARIAAEDLTEDIQRVTGRRPRLKYAPNGLSKQAVLVGTIGRSGVIDRLAQSGKLHVGDIENKWESFVIQTVPDPMPGVQQALVIAGSDRRGTAYGVYELSRRIGVSPWYWWADVTPKRRKALHVSPVRLRVGPPAVKYRGIFINDEMWGIRAWAAGNFAPDEGMGLGPKTHAKIFELLLRLRANHLWPAMHRGTIPFNYYPRNKVVADDYAIVMGTSHIEPMLRNNMHGAEWDREDGTAWNYLTNRDAIYNYWERRVKTNGRYENIYTIGMRGKDDEAMTGGNTTQDKINLLERIFRDQRQILSEHVNEDPSKVPQVFIPYTEVLGIYDSGLTVPDDAIICWPDDNFGYIRRLPNEREQQRSGGSGIYYHIQWLNGATTAYTWLNTQPISLIWTEMNKARQYRADKLWVLNVGDIKPGEIGMEYFLDMAWNPQRWTPDNLRQYLVQWAQRDLDPRFAEPVADLMMEYYRLGFTRRPEHLIQRYGDGPFQYSWFSHDHYNDEAQQRLDRYAALAERARAIYEKIPLDRKDAFFQLVLYPVQCSHRMNQKVIYADKSMRCAAWGSAAAGQYARQARAAAKRIIELTEHYNTGLLTAGDKWNYMMSWAPGPWGRQRHQFEMPPVSDFVGLGAPTLGLALEGGDARNLADLSVYTQGRRFVDLFNKGKGTIRWKAEPSQPWIKIKPASGSFATEQRIWITVDWNRAPKGKDVKATIAVRSDGGEQQVAVPVFNPQAPPRHAVKGYVESHGCVSMEAEHFARRNDRGGAGWRAVEGLGRSGDSVTVLPATVASYSEPAQISAHSPSMEYDFTLFHTGDLRLDVDCLPTLSVGPGRGARLAVSIDGSQPRILTTIARTGQSRLTNLRRFTETIKIDKPGKHTLTVWMVDPGVVVDKIVLHTKTPPTSYSGPPESYRR